MKKMYKPLSWKPVRHGATYCAPACGHGCTVADHAAAQQAGAELARTFGRGWSFHINENLGWYYSAVSPCGRITVSPGTHAGQKVTGYIAFLGEPDSCGGRWAEHGRTPRAAVRNVIRVAKTELERIGAMIKGLPEVTS